MDGFQMHSESLLITTVHERSPVDSIRFDSIRWMDGMGKKTVREGRAMNDRSIDRSIENLDLMMIGIADTL